MLQATPTETLTPATPAWWQTEFSKERYLRTYAHLFTPERTAREAEFIILNLGLAPGASVLDLGCGHGRIANALAKRGVRVTGLDYSEPSLEWARHEAADAGVDVEWIRGDMRQIRYALAYDAILSVYTSFGYFSDEENAALVHRVRAALRPKGAFFLDVQNTIVVTRQLAAEGHTDPRTGVVTRTREERLQDGLLVIRTDTWNPQTRRWAILKTWEEDGRPAELRTDVRFYTRDELHDLLYSRGLTLENVWGDYDGAPFNEETSPRLILSAHR